MESQKSCCIKVSYGGCVNYIICPAGSTYEDILKIAIERFSIGAEYHGALSLTNEAGYTFDKHLFEYFVLLFPSPEIIFFVRVDYAKVQALIAAAELQKAKAEKKPQPLGYSHLNNKRRSTEMSGGSGEEETAEGAAAAAPVRRQNCFIGAMPLNGLNGTSAAGSAAVARPTLAEQRRVDEASATQAAKRIKMSQRGHVAKQNVKKAAGAPAKRLLRV